jgi:hypothetical protein
MTHRRIRAVRRALILGGSPMPRKVGSHRRDDPGEGWWAGAQRPQPRRVRCGKGYRGIKGYGTASVGCATSVRTVIGLKATSKPRPCATLRMVLKLG